MSDHDWSLYKQPKFTIWDRIIQIIMAALFLNWMGGNIIGRWWNP